MRRVRSVHTHSRIEQRAASAAAKPAADPSRVFFHRAILEAAARLEANATARRRWYADDPIAGLGGLTAQALVALGRGWQVLRFLRELEQPRRA